MISLLIIDDLLVSSPLKGGFLIMVSLQKVLKESGRVQGGTNSAILPWVAGC